MSTVEVVVGRIGKPHGIRGEVTVDVRSDEPERRYVDGAVLAAQPPRGGAFAHTTLTVAGTRWHQGVLLARFAELGDRTAAETARGVLLRASIDENERPEDPDEFYDHQLIGLAAHDVDGTHLGEVVGLTHGAQDLLRIRTTAELGGHEALVPFVAALVPEVDLEAARVVIDDRPGLVTPFAEDAAVDAEDADDSERGA